MLTLLFSCFFFFFRNLNQALQFANMLKPRWMLKVYNDPDINMALLVKRISMECTLIASVGVPILFREERWEGHRRYLSELQCKTDKYFAIFEDKFMTEIQFS